MVEPLKDKVVIAAIKAWVETMVVGLNLCPFAKREILANSVRFNVTQAISDEQLLTELQIELERLNIDSSIETTLLIHPNVLQDFYAYNQFLDNVDGLLIEMDLEGVYQVASFHPDYQFADTEPDDAENYTNRSPYPVLHLLREASMEQAVANYPDSAEIPERNITRVNLLGRDKMQALLLACSHNPMTQ